MNRRHTSKLILSLLVVLSGSRLWTQGPAYQTADPEPVDLHHYEFYLFGSTGGTPVETDAMEAAIEFNWGAIPRVQLHTILPPGVIAPASNPIYSPGGTGPNAFAVIDIELGAKIAMIKGSRYVPQIGTLTMFELPTPSYDRGLGVGKVWYQHPLWFQKDVAHWLLDGVPVTLASRKPNIATINMAASS